MIKIDEGYLEAKITGIDFKLKNFVPERLGVVQMMLTGAIANLNLNSGSWPYETINGVTVLRAKHRSVYVPCGEIPDLRKMVWDSSLEAIDQYNRACRHRCELVDLLFYADLGDGNIVLVPQATLITAMQP